MTLNFSIGKELVIDCEMEGWSETTRKQFMFEAGCIAGVTSVSGAGHSSARVRYSSQDEEQEIRKELVSLANKLQPGRNFDD